MLVLLCTNKCKYKTKMLYSADFVCLLICLFKHQPCNPTMTLEIPQSSLKIPEKLRCESWDKLVTAVCFANMQT